MCEEPEAKNPRLDNNGIATRGELIAYLAYAVREVAVYSEMSAYLLRLAIKDLEKDAPEPHHREAAHTLS